MAMAAPDQDEVTYYRAVEDHFAALRGTPFLFSPKDFALLRGWYKGGVPLAAVLAGIGEAWERRRERDGDPISSLSYCRHAVTRHARRLLAAHVGTPQGGGGIDTAGALHALAERVADAGARWLDVPSVAAVLADLERALASLPADSDPSALDEALAGLEVVTLDALLGSLPAEQRDAIAAAVDAELVGLDLAADAYARTRRALLAKALRRVVGLPRLEVATGAR
jgi:hypothetical protein